MSPLHQCFAGQPVTRRLASGCLLGSGGQGTGAVSRSGVWVHRSYSSGRSKLVAEKGNVRRLRANNDISVRGFRYGYNGYAGYALQWRRGLCSSSEARVKTAPGARSATWFIEDPTRVMPSDVISKLPSLPQSDDISHTVPVLLVTPAFASWVVNPHPFLRESITHLFQNARRNISGGHAGFVYSVVTVVDKLPVPSTNSIQREGEEGRDKLGGKSGCEGISLFLVDRDALTTKVAPSLQNRDMSTPETEPTLSYLYRQIPTKRVSPAVTTFTEVGIRLANTVFLNGKSRTMLASRWRYSSHSEPNHESPTLTLDKEYNLLNCQINGATKPHEVTARVPLHPVTKPRVITTSMGNIISQLRHQDDGSRSTIHASAELEKALPAYLEANNLQNQRVAVWALVRPVSLQGGLHVASGMSAATADPLVAINEGARLHRVVSGGGGWGKKQGLLSLDPEYSYQTAGDAALGSGRVRLVHEIFEEVASGSEAAAEVEEDSEQMANLVGESVPGSIQFKDGRLTTDLSEIAKEGDTVQFLVAPLDSLRPSSSKAEKDEKVPAIDADPRKRIMQISFGVIPSSETEFGEETYDPDIDQATMSGGDGDGDGGIIAVPNYFGALSEKSFIYSIFNEMAPKYGNCRGGPGTLVQGTKIDVPGSRIMIESVEQHQPTPANCALTSNLTQPNRNKNNGKPLPARPTLTTVVLPPVSPSLLRDSHTQPDSPLLISNRENSLRSTPTTFKMPTDLCPVYAPFFGVLGCTSAIVFTCFGAAYGTAKAGVGVCATSVLRPDLIVKNIVPIVMAGIIGIYGLVVSVLIANDLKPNLPLYTGFIQLGAGLSVGLAGLAAGFAIGIVGDAGIRGTAQQSRLFVAMILILIFAEVLGLYGLIVALLMNSRANLDAVC
ncbi:V-type proton ATPase proteolipid subunit [Blastomyces percursus]|uniref:V-type proton ATPase subunit C n=1 Tax=Blastomyces percursus TaxID=1658174 RepID=A0A1J9Q0X8_9EURO|nr:V-type proton ATPase proteolipid subunit [Blastomyces percursus]